MEHRQESARGYFRINHDNTVKSILVLAQMYDLVAQFRQEILDEHVEESITCKVVIEL